MRHQFSAEKPLHWVSASKKDLLTFPEEVVDEIGYALGVVQHGEHPHRRNLGKGRELVSLRLSRMFREYISGGVCGALPPSHIRAPLLSEKIAIWYSHPTA